MSEWTIPEKYLDQTEQIQSLQAENNALVVVLEEAKTQIEYLHDKFKTTGSGKAVIAHIEQALEKVKHG